MGVEANCMICNCFYKYRPLLEQFLLKFHSWLEYANKVISNLNSKQCNMVVYLILDRQRATCLGVYRINIIIRLYVLGVLCPYSEVHT